MNLHFLCDFSLGHAEAALIVPGCLFAVTGALRKPPFSIPTSLNSVRNALWFLTMKRKDIQKHQLCVPCSLKLSFVEIWWVTTITVGGSCWVVPTVSLPCSRAGAQQQVPQGNLHTRKAPAPPSIPNTAEQCPSSPLKQKGLVLPSASTPSTHTVPSPVHFCIWFLTHPSCVLDLFQQYFSADEGG